MSDLLPSDDVPHDETSLLGYLVDLVEQGRRVAAVRMNAALTLTYWLIGRAIALNTLRNGRADNGRAILASLGKNWVPGSRLGLISRTSAAPFRLRQRSAMGIRSCSTTTSTTETYDGSAPP